MDMNFQELLERLKCMSTHVKSKTCPVFIEDSQGLLSTIKSVAYDMDGECVYIEVD